MVNGETHYQLDFPLNAGHHKYLDDHMDFVPDRMVVDFLESDLAKTRGVTCGSLPAYIYFPPNKPKTQDNSAIQAGHDVPS
jgi:hypothetical protein